jgi:hypothetical protein
MEDEYITGVIVRTTEFHGIDVPLNRAVLALLRALDRSPQSSSVVSTGGDFLHIVRTDRDNG